MVSGAFYGPDWNSRRRGNGKVMTARKLQYYANAWSKSLTGVPFTPLQHEILMYFGALDPAIGAPGSDRTILGIELR